MRTERFFRFLWRLNAVLIFVVMGTAFVLGSGAVLSEVGCNAQRRRSIEAAPNVVGHASEKLYLGPVRAVEGSDVLRGELLAPGDVFGKGSSDYRRDTRNILYLDTRSTEARWLLPDSRRIIAEEETIWAEDPGGLGPRALGLVMEWAMQHRNELVENWTLSRTKQPLKSIAPLE